MKSIFILILILVSFIACNHRNKLNYIAFNVSKDVMIDSLKNATVLLDKMDFGNGAACFVVDGNLHFSGKEFGFNIIKLPDENSTTLPIIEPFDKNNSIRFLKIVLFFNKNGIYGMSKRADGLFWFGYRQLELNRINDYNNERYIIYAKEQKDTIAHIFSNQVVVDRYKNIFLVAPDTYKDKKLPMDKKSILKRAKESREKRIQKNK